MNSNLLTNIARTTGGKYYTKENCDQFLNNLNNSDKFLPSHVTVKSEISLRNLPWLITIAILCLSIEWFLRKRSGML